eukprot:SAG25_NODE_2073_length_1983_cov_1.434183_1_plen_488_part_00
MAGGLNCYFGCMGGFSECGPSLDCHFIRGVRVHAGRAAVRRPEGPQRCAPMEESLPHRSRRSARGQKVQCCASPRQHQPREGEHRPPPQAGAHSEEEEIPLERRRLTAPSGPVAQLHRGHQYRSREEEEGDPPPDTTAVTGTDAGLWAKVDQLVKLGREEATCQQALAACAGDVAAAADMLMSMADVPLDDAGQSIQGMLLQKYSAKLGGEKVQVQVCGMGLQVFPQKGSVTTHMYKTLQAWGETEEGFEITTSDGKTLVFVAGDGTGQEICLAMTDNATKLAQAATQKPSASSPRSPITKPRSPTGHRSGGTPPRETRSHTPPRAHAVKSTTHQLVAELPSYMVIDAEEERRRMTARAEAIDSLYNPPLPVADSYSVTEINADTDAWPEELSLPSTIPAFEKRLTHLHGCVTAKQQVLRAEKLSKDEHDRAQKQAQAQLAQEQISRGRAAQTRAEREQSELVQKTVEQRLESLVRHTSCRYYCRAR